jgi:hypothetical protein
MHKKGSRLGLELHCQIIIINDSEESEVGDNRSLPISTIKLGFRVKVAFKTITGHVT